MYFLHYEEFSISVSKDVFFKIVDTISSKYTIYKNDCKHSHIKFTFYNYYTDYDDCLVSIGHMEEEIED